MEKKLPQMLSFGVCKYDIIFKDSKKTGKMMYHVLRRELGGYINA